MLTVKRFVLIIGFIIGFLTLTTGQSELEVVKGTVHDGDTIPVVELREVLVVSWADLSKREERKLTRLMKNVKIVYPFARLAGIKLVEYEDLLANAADRKERKQIIRQMQDEIERDYGKDLRDLTFTQGKILLKLVDRETGNSSYNLVSDLKGEVAAVFYQTIARIFTYDLKVKYDPTGEDRDIELIIQMIESGLI